jgi:Txe/YoeB family toxin of Txe-Axe toxin-antitoxin module
LERTAALDSTAADFNALCAHLPEHIPIPSDPIWVEKFGQDYEEYVLQQQEEERAFKKLITNILRDAAENKEKARKKAEELRRKMNECIERRKS